MTLKECIAHIPPLDQDDVRDALAKVHTCLLHEGATDQGGQKGQIAYRYLRNRIIVTGTVATGRSDRYSVHFNRIGFHRIHIIRGHYHH